MTNIDDLTIRTTPGAQTVSVLVWLEEVGRPLNAAFLKTRKKSVFLTHLLKELLFQFELNN